MTYSRKGKTGQLSVQSESPAVSVIMRAEPRSIERMVVRKSPFSVWTVTVDRPLPGGPDKVGIAGVVGLGDGDGVGVGMGVGVGVGVGELII